MKQIGEIYKSVLLSVDAAAGQTPLTIEFYPYVGVSSRIRRRYGALFVRISDVLRDAPDEFQRALAQILIRKLYRRRVSERDLRIYRDYLKQTAVHEKSIENRRARGRKVITSAQGAWYDLNEIFDFLNQLYFRGEMEKPVLTWSAKKTFRTLGHHDAAHDTIAVSKSLDDKKVPRFVVEYVVYHEMLHVKHPTKFVRGRRYSHTPEFRRDEENFAYFDEAESWIESNAAAMKRKAKI